MSGGAFDYVYNLDGRDLLHKFDVVENFELMRNQLVEYGDPSKQVLENYDVFVEKLKTHRTLVEEMENELLVLLTPMKQVLRATEYHASHDWGKDDVLKELNNYNSTTKLLTQGELQ